MVARLWNWLTLWRSFTLYIMNKRKKLNVNLWAQGFLRQTDVKKKPSWNFLCFMLTATLAVKLLCCISTVFLICKSIKLFYFLTAKKNLHFRLRGGDPLSKAFSIIINIHDTLNGNVCLHMHNRMGLRIRLKELLFLFFYFFAI